MSDQGRVRSVDRVVEVSRNGSTYQKRLKGKVLQQMTMKGREHVVVNLQGVGKPLTKYVHQIVAEAWIGPCPDGYEVCHGPSGGSDNSASNLSYGTPSDNNHDKRRDGTHGGRPVVRSDGVEFINMHVAAEQTGCYSQGIWNVCNGRSKSAAGYGWRYA